MRISGSGPGSAGEYIIQRARRAGRTLRANDNVADLLRIGDRDAMEAEAKQHVAALLRCLAIDTEADHNTRDTPGRFARMLVREVFSGRFEPAPSVTDFPNAGNLDQCYVVGPATVRSACSHHLVPITGKAWVGIIPSERVIGLSKFNRLVNWIMSRPQIQEEATVQLADALEEATKPRGLAVVVRAEHFCCAWRGVRDPGSAMTTSVMRGSFREDASARAEFMALIRGMGF